MPETEFATPPMTDASPLESDDARRLNGFPDDELSMIEMFHPNCMLTGTDIFVDDALILLSSTFRRPVALRHAGHPLQLPPASDAATLILREISALTEADQHRLARWIEQAAGRTQIVVTTSAPLWPLVQRGLFLEKLYYRLNTLVVVLP